MNDREVKYLETNNKKTDAFLAAIKSLADEECKKIDDETDKIRVERLNTLQGEAEARYKAYEEYEIDRIKADTNRELSAYEDKARKEITDLRNELCSNVFSEAFEAINKFTSSKEYKNILLESAKEIAKSFPEGNVEIYLCERDMVLGDEIKKAFSRDCKIIKSDDIKLGGIKAIDTKTNCLADDTLDTKLANQKDWFLEKSGLSIEE